MLVAKTFCSDKNVARQRNESRRLFAMYSKSRFYTVVRQILIKLIFDNRLQKYVS